MTAQEADQFWQKSLSGKSYSDKRINQRLAPKSFEVYQLNIGLFRSVLKQAIHRNENTANRGILMSFPNEKGILEKYRVYESSIMAESLQKKFPSIRSYIGEGIDNPGSTVRFSVGAQGLHAMFLNKSKQAFYIDPYSDERSYMGYSSKSLPSLTPFICEFEDPGIGSHKKTESISAKAANANDGKLRKFRLAIATTGEYSQFHLSNQGISTGSSIEEKKTAVLSAIVTTMTRVNGIFERDVSLTMELVSNNSEIIFLDATTDGLTNNDGSSLIDEGQSIIDNVIGVNNYDIGHTFSTGGGGLAQLNSPCTSGKARAATGSSTPIGDPYYIDFVAHEMGHQFGAHHTFNGNSGGCEGNGNIGTAVEPGSGSTIMAYAGLCAPNNVESASDFYFHFISIREIWNNISDGNSKCAEIIETGNDAPVLPDVVDYTIPVGTPFVLDVAATDPNDDQLTYTWEQLDIESTTYPLVSTATEGPAFRSIPPSSSSARYFPDQNTVIAGSLSNTWEVVPTVARDMRFGVTVRDNNIQGGQTDSKETSITFHDGAGPFKVTSQASSETWDAGTGKTISWDVANTSSAPINTNFVNILMSFDGGYTYPIVLASNVANDGSHEIITPNVTTDLGRIKVEGVGNIFYAMNAADISIQASEFIMEIDTPNKKTCVPDEVSVTFDYKTFLDFNEETTFSATGLPTGTSAVFNPATAIDNNTSVTLTISGIQNESIGSYSITLIGISASTVKSTAVSLDVFSSLVSEPNLLIPGNNEQGILKPYSLSWEGDINAINYEIQVSTDESFNSILETDILTVNSYDPEMILPNTSYYWRVKSINDCGESGFSTAYEFTSADEVCEVHNSNDTPLSIPDNNSAGLNSISIVGEEDNMIVSDVNLTVNISHTWVEDLSLVLISPQGTPVILATNIGSDGNNYANTVFDNEASTSIFSGTPPYTGSFRPQGNLLRFNGEESYGNWVLKIVDSEAEDTGSLLNWSLEICGVLVNDNDSDRDGVPNDIDACPNSPLGSEVDATGCSSFTLPANNFSIQTVGQTCPQNNNGQLTITALEPQNYFIIWGQEKYEFTSSLTLNDLEPGTYDICVFVTNETYEQCYELEIAEAPSISGKMVVNSNRLSIEIEEGTAPYGIFINGNRVLETNNTFFDIQIEQGDLVEVKTAISCEGTLSRKIGMIDQFKAYPNPTNDIFKVAVFDVQNEIVVEVYNGLSQLIETKNCTITDGIITVNLEGFASGIYFVKLLRETPVFLKIIKE
jgi:subtilisin-like proprotein convertase family protein